MVRRRNTPSVFWMSNATGDRSPGASFTSSRFQSQSPPARRQDRAADVPGSESGRRVARAHVVELLEIRHP